MIKVSDKQASVSKQRYRSRVFVRQFGGDVVLVLLLWTCVAFTQPPGAAPSPASQKAGREIRLYPGAAPGSEAWDWSERSVISPAGLPMVQDAVRPVLLHYPADRGKAVGAAMI